MVAAGGPKRICRSRGFVALLVVWASDKRKKSRGKCRAMGRPDNAGHNSRRAFLSHGPGRRSDLPDPDLAYRSSPTRHGAWVLDLCYVHDGCQVSPASRQSEIFLGLLAWANKGRNRIQTIRSRLIDRIKQHLTGDTQWSRDHIRRSRRPSIDNNELKFVTQDRPLQILVTVARPIYAIHPPKMARSIARACPVIINRDRMRLYSPASRRGFVRPCANAR